MYVYLEAEQIHIHYIIVLLRSRNQNLLCSHENMNIDYALTNKNTIFLENYYNTYMLWLGYHFELDADCRPWTRTSEELAVAIKIVLIQFNVTTIEQIELSEKE